MGACPYNFHEHFLVKLLFVTRQSSDFKHIEIIHILKTMIKLIQAKPHSIQYRQGFSSMR
ncbi:hypothetical protein RchiOBHm_Chr2g0139791 [Rosa chinensis]|uniref:Uncharacterized protein n=1 Tax=Rosa chinensis TaxID=74649 RepID=A0A2P6RX76_ROSCH|nr:hypothetical protein RchiOBHm_Chr2g0139791 [Rosa chinensis]